MMAKHITRTTELPRKLVEKINKAGFSENERNKFIKFTQARFYHLEERRLRMDEYIDTPSSYLRKVLGGDYSKIVQKAKKASIIEIKMYVNRDGKVVEFFHPDNHQCKANRISPVLLRTGDWVTVEFVDYDKSGPLVIGGMLWDRQEVYKDFSSLKFNANELLAAVPDAVEAKIRTLQTIPTSQNKGRLQDVEVLQVTYSGELIATHSDQMGMEKAHQKALNLGGEVFVNGDKITIADRRLYEQVKRETMLFSYHRTVRRLLNGYFYCDRNETNNRLDHNYTTLPGFILDVIKKENDLVEIDLGNSQFAFLADWMRKDPNFEMTEDADLFCRLAGENELYKYIGKECELVDSSNPGVMCFKDAGKAAMFSVCFSKYRHRTGDKPKVKRVFPSVITFIDSFKKRKLEEFKLANPGISNAEMKRRGINPEAEFSNELARRESQLFVDTFYAKLKGMGYFVITKHDSLIVRSGDAREIVSIMEAHFKAVDFHCKLKVSGSDVLTNSTTSGHEVAENQKSMLDVLVEDSLPNEAPSFKEYYKSHPHRSWLSTRDIENDYYRTYYGK